MIQQRAFLGQVPIAGVARDQSFLGQQSPVNYPWPTEAPPRPPTPEECRDAKAEMDKWAKVIASQSQELSKHNTAAKEALRKKDYIASDHAANRALIAADVLASARMYYGFAEGTYSRCPRPTSYNTQEYPVSYPDPVHGPFYGQPAPPPPTPTPSRPRNIPQGADTPTPTGRAQSDQYNLTPKNMRPDVATGQGGCPQGQFPDGYGGCRGGVDTRRAGLLNQAMTLGPSGGGGMPTATGGGYSSGGAPAAYTMGIRYPIKNL